MSNLNSVHLIQFFLRLSQTSYDSAVCIHFLLKYGNFSKHKPRYIYFVSIFHLGISDVNGIDLFDDIEIKDV